MSFELQTQENPDGTTKEILEETITHQTRKLWTKKEIERDIAALEAQITILQGHLARFTK